MESNKSSSSSPANGDWNNKITKISSTNNLVSHPTGGKYSLKQKPDPSGSSYLANQHLVYKNTKRPPISGRVITPSLQYLEQKKDMMTYTRIITVINYNRF